MKDKNGTNINVGDRVKHRGGVYEVIKYKNKIMLKSTGGRLFSTIKFNISRCEVIL